MRFKCLPGCTECCRQAGFVYLTEQDLARAAAHLNLSAGVFEKRYVYKTRHRRRLRKPRGGTCSFLQETGCRLHPDKPTQCRTFPFWPEVAEDPGAFRYCPGIDEGPLIRPEDIRRAEDEMRAGYPEMY